MQIEGTLSIIEVKGAPTKSNKLTVRIEKINETGLRFFSDLSFPLDSQIIFTCLVLYYLIDKVNIRI